MFIDKAATLYYYNNIVILIELRHRMNLLL